MIKLFVTNTANEIKGSKPEHITCKLGDDEAIGITGLITSSRVVFQRLFEAYQNIDQCDWTVDAFMDRGLGGCISRELVLHKLGWSITGHCSQVGNPTKRGSYDDTCNVFALTVKKNGKQVGDVVTWRSGCAHMVQLDMSNKWRPIAFTGSSITPYGSQQIHPRTPGCIDVLYGLFLDATCVLDRTHEEFCDELGYDVDSIKDRDCYLACQKTLQAMRPYLNELQPVVENY